LKFVVHVPEHYLSYAFDCHIDHLMVGALTAITLRSAWFRSFWEGICRPSWASVSIALLAVSVALQHRFEHAYDHTFGFIVDPILIAILLIQVISLESLPPFSWLNLSAARFFGRISYPLYLYHIFAIDQAYKLFPAYNWRVSVVASLVCAVAFATASYLLVEKRFLRLKERFLPLPPKARAALAAASGA
jgi:peptidoglycan/LPS O-acetylase OafA/YrhL